MTDANEPQLYLVVAPVGAECYGAGHRLDPMDDVIVCLDCSAIARRAALAVLDVDAAVTAFRQWNLKEEPE